MYMTRMSPIMSVVPVAVLLALSFFVLFALRKVEERALRAFGYLVVGFLWLASLVILLAPVSNMGMGPRGTKYMMYRKAMKGDMPAMAVTGRSRAPVSGCAGNKGTILKSK